MKYKTYNLEELVKIKYGKNQAKVVCNNGSIPIYGTGGLMGYSKIPLYDKPSVLIGRKGTINKVRYVNDPFWTVDTLFYTIINESLVLPKYLYYLLSTINFDYYNEGTSIPSLRTETLNKISLNVPCLEDQRATLSILSPLDDLIKANTKINDYLLYLLQTIYLSFDKSNWNSIVAGEFFDISIGKTPPRKEQGWFSTSNDEKSIPWVSISDMGKSGVFIDATSERLTKEAVNRFNVVIVPDNTVLLSFKLTVGRVSITNGNMCTNEAIAHFKTNDERLNELLYVQLLAYNYDELGSTSSIATAVNSKTIKSMELLIPDKEDLDNIHALLKPVMDSIRSNQNENYRLTSIRDILLPKLMSGEIDVSGVDLGS